MTHLTFIEALRNIAFIAVLFAILLLQLLLCFKTRSRMIRFIRIVIFVISGIVFLILSCTVTGWDALGYIILALLSGYGVAVCGIGFLIWGIVQFIRKRKN